MSWSRTDSRILLGAILAGLLVAVIVAFPRWVEDSRMVLEVRFTDAPERVDPSFKLRYDRGRGMNSLRVVLPSDAKTEAPERFHWEFDSRPMQALQIGIRDWSGPLAVESASLTDREGRVLYEFDPALVRLADPAKQYPLPTEQSLGYHRLILPVSGETMISRHHGFSSESVKSTLVGFVLGGGVFWFAFQLCRTRPFLLGWIRFFRTSYPEVNLSARPQRWVVLSSLVLLGVLVLARSWENFLHPSLFVEDAFHYFNRYYGTRIPFLAAVFQNPNGYFNILPNAVAWCFSYLDVRFLPGAYVAFAVAFALFAVVLPLATGVFRSRWIVFLVPIVLGLSGLNHVFYFTTITFQMYIVILVLLVLLFLPAPKSYCGLAWRILIGGLFVFSGPYSVVVVPAGLLLLVLYQPSKQSFFWAAMIFSGFVFMETTTGMLRLENVVEPSTLERMALTMIDRILFFDLIEVGILFGAGIILFLLTALFAILWRDSEFRRIGTVFLAIVLLAMAPLFLSQKFLLYSEPYDCHILISQFFWLLFLLYAADRFVERVGKRFPIGAVFFVLFIAFVWVDQVKNPQKGYYPPNPEIMPFMEKVREVEELNLEHRNEYILLKGTGATQAPFNPLIQVGSNRSDARKRELSDFE